VIILNERTPITNFLLLSVLAGILLVSGSLQWASVSLSHSDSLVAPSLYAFATRVDTCHQSIEHALPTPSCLNKACHQRVPQQRDLGGPQIYQLHKLPQPLYSSSRQPVPLYRSGTAIILPHNTSQALLSRPISAANRTQQSLASIRTTVLRC
jgi:hypothetical protein